MPPKELPEHAPGRYVPYDRNPYYSPDPLPIDPEIEISTDVRDLAINAAHEIGRVDGISHTVDFSAALYTTLIRIEAVESARIEGADVDYQDVEAYHTRHADTESDVTVEKDLQEAINYEKALTYGLDAIGRDDEITLGLITHLHEMILDGVRNAGDVVGAFRDHMVNLRSPKGGQTPFVPPTPEKVEALMDSLEAYIQEGGAYHPLIDAAVIHYFFETVHPFSDGNGRLGRLLIILFLSSEGFIESPYIYPSAYFNRNKFDYVDKMRSVSEEGAWNDWLAFFLEGLRSQAERSHARTMELIDLQEEYEARYDGETATDRFARQLLRKPYFAPPELIDFLDVSRPTAYSVVENLERDGLVREVTGKENNKQYMAVHVYEILE